MPAPGTAVLTARSQSVPHGPLARYLEHPGATTGAVLRHLGHVLAPLGLRLGPIVIGIALVAGIAVGLIRRREAARMAEGARLVRVLAPPEVDPEGAATLWSNLVALLRPAWRRVLGGQPHLGFELRADRAGLGIAIWVPGVVPPGLVERAVEAAWPGARTETIPSAPPLPGGGLVTGGELRLAVAECYPLRVEHRVDPLRPLLGALAGLAGAYLSLAYAPTWLENMTNGRGWIAIVLVIFATWNPLKAALGALLFGCFDVLGFRFQAMGLHISPYFLGMLPYLITIIVLVMISVTSLRAKNPMPKALTIPYDREER